MRGIAPIWDQAGADCHRATALHLQCSWRREGESSSSQAATTRPGPDRRNAKSAHASERAAQSAARPRQATNTRSGTNSIVNRLPDQRIEQQKGDVRHGDCSDGSYQRARFAATATEQQEHEARRHGAKQKQGVCINCERHSGSKQVTQVLRYADFANGVHRRQRIPAPRHVAKVDVCIERHPDGRDQLIVAINQCALLAQPCLDSACRFRAGLRIEPDCRLPDTPAWRQRNPRTTANLSNVLGSV